MSETFDSNDFFVPKSELEIIESNEFYGYVPEFEDQEYLDSLEDFSKYSHACMGEYPEEIDPRKWHRIENQKSIGSCQGHAQTSVAEKAFFNKTGRLIQFSPIFAYYATQEIDGLKGSDRGSTISGGVKCAKTVGLCLLDEAPYPNPPRYRWNISQHQRDVASQYKIKSSLVMKSYEDIYNYLGSGQGGVEIGVVWNNTMTPDKNGCINDCNVRSGGGHALAFLGYTSGQDLDPDGNRYLWMANSWDVRWGLEGWAKVAKRVVEKQLATFQGRGQFIGMSDMETPEYRKVDYSLW